MARAKAQYDIVANDKTKKGFDSVQSRIKRTTGAFRGMGSAIAGIAGAAGIGALVKSSLDAADEVQKLSIQLGASTEFLSEMAHVAELSGVSFKAFTNGIRQSQRSIVEAARGSETYVRELEKLNLVAEDLIKLKPEDQFNAIAKAMQGVTSESQRSAIAQQLFGRGGSELLRIINQGIPAMEAMREESKALGLSLNRDAADAAANANDALTRMTGAFKGLGLSIVSDFAEPLTGAVDFLRGTVVPVLGFLLDLVIRVGQAFGGLAASIGQLSEGNIKGAFNTLFSATGDFASGITDDASKRIQEGSDVLGRIGVPSTTPADKTPEKIDELKSVMQEVARNTGARTAAVAG